MSPLVVPALPSSVLRWSGETAVRVPPSTNAIVAVTGTANWGPKGQDSANALTKAEPGSKLYLTLAEFEADYGTDDTPLRDAVLGAFIGMNVPGGLGAGGVIPYRLANADVAATLTRNNTGATPAVRFTAIYTGSRGNDISVVIEDDPVDATKDRLRVLFRGATVESYSYLQTDIAALVTAINGRSRYIFADGPGGGAVVTGTALLASAGVSLATGADGSTVTTTQFAGAQAVLAYKEFGIFAPGGLTDGPTKVQLAQWMRDQADEMRPFRMVLGGALNETVDDAITELNANGGALRDEHIIRFGHGNWLDDVTGKTYSTAQLAPRIAGVLAARGRKSALTRAMLGGLHAVGTPPTKNQLILGRDNGVTMLRRVSHPDAELTVSQGVTTFIAGTTAKPREFFGEPRIVGLLDGVLRELTAWGDDVLIGDLPVTDNTRLEVRKQVTKVLDELVATDLAQPGTVSVDVYEDENVPDAIPYRFRFKPSRTANYLIGEGRVS